MITETAGKCVLSISSTSDPLPTSSAFYPQSSQSQLPAAAPAGFSGAVVGGAIAALFILVVFAGAGVIIVIVALVSWRHNLQKLTNSTCTFTPSDLDDIQGDHPPVFEQSPEEMELQQNTCYAPSGSYKQGDPPGFVLFNQSADPVQLQQNMSYEATSNSYKPGDQVHLYVIIPL